jgi:hypothetical protein
MSSDPNDQQVHENDYKKNSHPVEFSDLYYLTYQPLQDFFLLLITKVSFVKTEEA